MTVNFLFDGRMEVCDLPDEVRRVVDLLLRAKVSHLLQVRLQLRLLDHDDEMLVHPDQSDLRDLMFVPPLKEGVSIDKFVDSFGNGFFEVSADLPHCLNRKQHVSSLRAVTGGDRGPPTIPKLLDSLNSAANRS
jgi:hypothetical protein